VEDYSSKLKTRVVNRIEELPREDWEIVFPKALENYYFFKSLDESSFEQFKFFYILIYDNDVPVGATSCFIMDFPIDIAVSGFLKKPLGFIKKLLPRIFNLKALMCGLPMGEGRIGILKNPDMVMAAISQALEEIAKKQKAPLVIFKDFNNSYGDILGPLLKKGYSKIESFPSTDMKIDFASFDDYLKTLNQSSRDNLKRNLKKADKVKIELTVKNALEEEELSQAYGLYLETYNKQEMGFEKLPIEFFRNVARNMPEEARFFLWRIEGKPVAFAFCLVSGDYFIDYYLGFDYSVAYRYFLYFVRFRDLLKWCIEHGIARYEMGATTYEPKRRLDFNFIRLYFYVRLRNKLFNKFSSLVIHFMKPENFDPIFEHLDNRS